MPNYQIIATAFCGKNVLVTYSSDGVRREKLFEFMGGYYEVRGRAPLRVGGEYLYKIKNPRDAEQVIKALKYINA